MTGNFKEVFGPLKQGLFFIFQAVLLLTLFVHTEEVFGKKMGAGFFQKPRDLANPRNKLARRDIFKFFPKTFSNH